MKSCRFCPSLSLPPPLIRFFLADLSGAAPPWRAAEGTYCALSRAHCGLLFAAEEKRRD